VRLPQRGHGRCTVETGLSRWRGRWEGAGVPTIPLQPGRKVPVCTAWQVRSSADQWHQVGGSDFRGNVGTVMGGGNAVIDCDAPAAVNAVAAGLAGMGVDPGRLPQVKTLHQDHLQFYIRVDGAPETGAFVHLAPDVGPGELRFGPGSYVCAPCSEVDGVRYRFTVGYPELLPTLRPISWQDLTWLIAPVAPVVGAALERPPIPLLKRAMPQRAEMLLRYLATASKGEPVTILDTRGMSVKAYRSRSEAEMAVVAMLILSGWELAEIESEFERRLPGHYRESRNGKRYLARTYAQALGTLAASPTRLQIVNVYREAQAAAWPGRGGLLERAVFCGLLSIAWQFDTWEPCASVRCLAEAAAASKWGVQNALERLSVAGLARRVEGWHADYATGELVATANRWRLTGEACTIQGHKTHVYRDTSDDQGVAGGGALWLMGAELCTGEGETAAPATAETWARVGRSAGAIYGHLGAEPRTVKDLAGLTGKHRNTVHAALARLLAYSLAEHTPGGWVRGAGSLADVAQEVGAEGHARQRRIAHNLQREAFYTHARAGGWGT